MVSHDASLTGAPRIALNLVKQLRSRTEAELTTILHHGGPLHPEFSKASPTLCLDAPREHHPSIHSALRKLIKPLQRSGRQVICICNSVESRFVANSIYTRNVPILYLLHEFPTSYPPGEYAKIYEYSRKMVFPCEAVRQAAHQALPIPDGQSVVCPQGLLDSDFGTRIPRPLARRRLRKSLGLPKDAFVVLGCGTVDLRKGIDHFLAVARTYAALDRRQRPVYFCWLGDGPRHPHSAYHYVELDLAKSRSDNVRMVGEFKNVEPYFMGADAFLLTSRVDPFPCVIHEAMAARLPIMVFDQSGGAVEAIDEGAGLVLPFADYVATANTIEQLVDQPQLTRQLGLLAHQRVREKYRFEDYADRIMDLCETEFGVQLGRLPAPLPSVSPPFTSPRRAA